MGFNIRTLVCVAAVLAGASVMWAQPTDEKCTASEPADGTVHITCPSGTIEVEMLEQNILRVDVRPGGKASPRTLVIDPGLKTNSPSGITVQDEGESTSVRSSRMTVSISHLQSAKISVTDAAGRGLVSQENPLEEARTHRPVFLHSFGENLYGMRGLERCDNSNSMLRNNGVEEVAAGAQGDGGAPFFFTTRYGVLIDSDGGSFFTQDNNILFAGDSRDELEYFVVAGSPMEVMSGLAYLTGRPPMPPKWTLGFLNSQWGSNEAEIKELTATYRQKHIPIDAFILDYDWKAWGEDNYGEFRWNSTSSPESMQTNIYMAPNKFPDGASGKFSQEMREQGIKLAGILKPKIFVYKKGSTAEMHEAAAYAEAHDLWYPGEPKVFDFGREQRDLDFSKAETRAWYWKHVEPSFDAGMIAWWNDEADHAIPPSGHPWDFNNFQSFNMGRMLYEGQRGYSNLRVWSINRNYYLGAQRYGYAEWSGDIQTGFESMQNQRYRMLSTLNLGEPHWSMDTGGFEGHPTPENYARWMEFAAFVPIDRVHGTFGEKRQPWIYGPVAEAAATRALQLRYTLLPYIYSYERTATETGVGIVRPLLWVFPDDPHVANDGSAWMFGDSLLVSPVIARGAAVQSVYLPAGTWYDYNRGTRFNGGQTIRYKVDPQTWQDIPLFIRRGAVIATQPVQDYVDQHPATEITLDVFPDRVPGQFNYYDDDGTTYAYERGVYYRQSIRASDNGTSVGLQLGAPDGSFKPTLRFYLVRVHGRVARAVLRDGKALAKLPAEDQLIKSGEAGWTTGRDRFGPVTLLRIPAQHASDLTLR